MKKLIVSLIVFIMVFSMGTVEAATIYRSQPNKTIKLRKGAKYTQVHAGDINNDGKKDILVCIYPKKKFDKEGEFIGYEYKGSVVAYYQKNGRFPLKPDLTFPSEYSPRGAIIKDIDGDGKNDIAYNDYAKRLYLCYAKNKFKPKEYTDTNMRADDLLDVNLNNALSDKLSASFLGRAVWWRVSKKGRVVKQTYIARPPYNQSGFPGAGDLDGDEETDLVYPEKKRLLLYYGPFTPASVLKPEMLVDHSILEISKGEGYIQQVCIGDFNADKRQDIACSVGKTGVLFLHQNAPQGFSEKVSAEIKGDFWKIETADINNDKLQDIVAIDSNCLSVRIFLQKKGGGFVTKAKDADQVIKINKAYDILLSDINGDGKKDLVVANTKRAIMIYYAK